MMMLLVACAGAGVLIGCGASAPAKTPAGSYTVNITVTDGTTSHTVAYPVTVN